MYVGKGYVMNGMFKLNVMVVKNDINKINSSAYLIESSNMWHGDLRHKIKVVRSDKGGEYVSPFSGLCVEHGIRHEFTAPYLLQQNGIAKNKNRTLKEMVNAVLISFGLGQNMWEEAILTATYLLNKIPHKEKEKTPYELWMGRKPSHHAYCFIVHDSKNPDIQKNGVMESRNASFFQNIFPCLMKKAESSSRLDDEVVQDKRQRYDNDLHDKRKYQLGEEDVKPRRSKRARTEKSFGLNFVSFMVENEPTSYREAVTSSKVYQWKEAIKSEIDSILQNHTWDLVDLPPGCKPLGYKWIFKKKMKADGTIDKYKKDCNDKMIKSTKDMLKSKFDMKDMGLADVILGIKIIQTHNGLVLNQTLRTPREQRYERREAKKREHEEEVESIKERLSGASLLVFANKQDIQGSLTPDEIAKVTSGDPKKEGYALEKMVNAFSEKQMLAMKVLASQDTSSDGLLPDGILLLTTIGV
nr:retrotransposon protein, putative, Ty1-copia subclass [Tanacetum cinerariifolium]